MHFLDFLGYFSLLRRGWAWNFRKASEGYCDNVAAMCSSLLFKGMRKVWVTDMGAYVADTTGLSHKYGYMQVYLCLVGLAKLQSSIWKVFEKF